ncbi:MAG: hypothetical protein ABJB12_12380 [Pseudomonadota bacterium]
MRSTASGGLVCFVLFGLLCAEGCGSDDDRSGAGGTTGTEELGAADGGAADSKGVAAGAGGNAAGGNAGAGEGGALAAGAAGMPDLPSVFPCAGPGIANGAVGSPWEPGEGGGAGAGQVDQTLPAVSCVTGESFCYVFAGRAVNPHVGTVYDPECRKFSDFAGKCSTNPSCACLCSRFACETECRCKESNGIATLTCQQI